MDVLLEDLEGRLDSEERGGEGALSTPFEARGPSAADSEDVEGSMPDSSSS